MCKRTIRLDLWVGVPEKLTLMREIDVFSPQTWEPRTAAFDHIINSHIKLWVGILGQQ